MDDLIKEYIEGFIAHPRHPIHPCALLIQQDRTARFGFDCLGSYIYWYFDFNKSSGINFIASGHHNIGQDFHHYRNLACDSRGVKIYTRSEKSEQRNISYIKRQKAEHDRLIKNERAMLIKCECGLMIRKSNIKRHQQTKIHLEKS
jgi:hypothetical protein